MFATRPAIVLSAVLVLSLPALADVITLVPDDPDLQDLPHAYYYKWGETLGATSPRPSRPRPR